MIKAKQVFAALCLGLSCTATVAAAADETGAEAAAAEMAQDISSGGEHSEAAVHLSLADSIDRALTADERIEGAAAEREQAKWGLSAARRAKGPSIGWQSTAMRIGGRDYEAAQEAHDLYGDPHQVTYTAVSGYVAGNPNYPVLSQQTATIGAYAMKNTFYNSWSLTVPLYTGGRLEGQIDANRYQLDRADLTLEDTRQQVRYDAAEAYANLLHYIDLERIAGESVGMAEKQLQLINDQYVEGAVAKADVLLMEVRLADYRQNQSSARSAVDTAMFKLASLVGLPQETVIYPTDVFTYEPYPKAMAECEAYALAHRPDGLAADYAVKAAEAQKDAAKSGYRPTLSGVVERSMTGNSPFRQERSSNWSAGVSLSWNVFDNGVTEANVRQAKAAIDQSLAAAERAKKNIRLETRTAYRQMKAAEESLRLAAAAVKQAEESHLIAQVRYEEGVDILLTVADAQERLTQARSNYCTALYQYNLYRAALEKAMGTPVELDVTPYADMGAKTAGSEGK